MCGISGIYSPRESSPANDETVRQMTNAMVHRGPDEEGYFNGRGISLGIRRLRVLDLSTGSQPISNEDNTIHVVANGEIYGFEAIRKSLEQKGHVFTTRTDVEVLVHLYEEHGLELFDHIDGMFAFCLWDAARERLLIARDRFGIKPLFYTLPDAAGQFAFCSELRPLLMAPGVSKDLDPVGIDGFFALSYIPQPRTAYLGIRKLAPGTALVAERGAVRTIQYWDFPSVAPELDPDPLGRLDAAIANSVRRMMRSDVPVGAFLSGGLDSGTVAWHMAQHSRERLKSYCVRFEDPDFDEGPLARSVAERIGSDHTDVWVAPDCVEATGDMMDHFGEPFADPAQLPTYFLSKEARREVTVALSGDGGDEILGGYSPYQASLLADYAGYLPDRFLSSLLKMTDWLPVSDREPGLDFKARKFLNGCRLAPLKRHLWWRVVFAASERQDLYSPGFADSIDRSTEDLLAEQWAHLFDGEARDMLWRYQSLDVSTYLSDNNLAKADRMTMAHSLELRVPFLDLEVVEAARHLEPLMRIRRLRTKIALRKLMKDRLPPEVVQLPKKGFVVPLASWFRGPLREYVEATLAVEQIERIPILRTEAVRRVVDAHLGGRANLNRQIWSLVCFVRWWERAVG